MNSDSVYRLLINSTWLFLSGWMVLLIAVSLITFIPEGSEQKLDQHGSR